MGKADSEVAALLKEILGVLGEISTQLSSMKTVTDRLEHQANLYNMRKQGFGV